MRVLLLDGVEGTGEILPWGHTVHSSQGSLALVVLSYCGLMWGPCLPALFYTAFHARITASRLSDLCGLSFPLTLFWFSTGT